MQLSLFLLFFKKKKYLWPKVLEDHIQMQFRLLFVIYKDSDGEPMIRMSTVSTPNN